MSQHGEVDDESGKMAISYASGLSADHTQSLPSFREVRKASVLQDPTPEYEHWQLTVCSFSRLIYTTKSSLAHTCPPDNHHRTSVLLH